MLTWFMDLSVLVRTLLATGFTWLGIFLGAALVFLFPAINKKAWMTRSYPCRSKESECRG